MPARGGGHPAHDLAPPRTRSRRRGGVAPDHPGHRGATEEGAAPGRSGELSRHSSVLDLTFLTLAEDAVLKTRIFGTFECECPQQASKCPLVGHFQTFNTRRQKVRL